MGVLRLNIGTTAAPDWRDVGCAGIDPGVLYDSVRGFYVENGYGFVDSLGAVWHDDTSTSATRRIRNDTGGTTTAFSRRTTPGGVITLSAAQTFTAGTVATIGAFDSSIGKYEYVLGAVPVSTGGTVLCSWTLGDPPTGKLRLQLPDGTWLREACAGDVNPRPLRVEESPGVWVTVACMVPV